MYAIVEIAGQQFKVAKDQKVFVHRLAQKEGEKIAFDKVLFLDNEGEITIGAPVIDGATVEAKVVKHLKGDKVIVFKKKRRKGYRVKNGHRQFLTELLIEGIISSGAQKATSAKVEKQSKKQAATAVKKSDTAESASKKTARPKEIPAVEPSKEDLSKKTVAELKEMAKDKGIAGISSMRKAELIAALSNK